MKDRSQARQKKMLADYFQKLADAPKTGQKVVYTFVPGNLTELILSFDLLPILPEINALQSGMRQKSKGYIREAEKRGLSADVCTYVKCDLGMKLLGNIGPTGLPRSGAPLRSSGFGFAPIATSCFGVALTLIASTGGGGGGGTGGGTGGGAAGAPRAFDNGLSANRNVTFGFLRS